MRRILPIAVLMTAAVVAGCGSSVSVDTKGKVTVGPKTLDVAALPFTFRYPASFQQATDSSVAGAHAVAVVGIPGQDTYFAVHLNGPTVMTLDALQTQAVSALGSDVIKTAREVHAGTPMVAVETRVSGRPDLTAAMYGFTYGGKTWLIQCRANAANRASMTQWCRDALDSLKPRS